MKLSFSWIIPDCLRVRPSLKKGGGSVHLTSISSAALAAAAFLLLGTPSKADDNNKYSASFSGFQEIGSLTAPTGAILSKGQGDLTLNVDKGNQFVHFRLTYSGLTNVTQSHIHFGKRHVAGGIMVFFCSNLTSPAPPPNTQPCPLSGGTVTGTITGTNVIGPTTQNVTPGDFNALLAALQSNTVYGNIHTQMFPSGEIRGQIKSSSKDN
jgi:CHRD domain